MAIPAIKYDVKTIKIPDIGIKQWIINDFPNGTFYIPIHFVKYIDGQPVDYAFSRFFPGCRNPEDYTRKIQEWIEMTVRLPKTVKNMIKGFFDKHVDYNMVIYCYSSINPWRPEYGSALILEDKITIIFV